MKLVTIADFDKPMDAVFMKSILEGYDIPCVVIDEHMSGLAAYSRAIGGIRLQVPEELAGQAREILNRQKNPGRPLTAKNKRNCPGCKSGNVTRLKIPIFLNIIFVLLLLIPFLFIADRLQCNDCGRKWKRKY